MKSTITKIVKSFAAVGGKMLMITLTLVLMLMSMMGYAQYVQLFNTSGTFTVPGGVTSIGVFCWGAGGGGMFGSSGYGGGGGGGGAYTQNTISATPGNTISVTVGTGGAGGVSPSDGGNGGASTFNSSTPITAIGGNGATSTSGAAGGSSGSGGSEYFTGGNGGTAGFDVDGGGGGAGSGYAGSGASGSSGSSSTGGSGGVGLNDYAGTGGNGGGTGGTGSAGTLYGAGGGGGGYSGGLGGNGANGLVIINWSATSFTLSSISNSGPICSGNPVTITVVNTTYNLPVNIYTVTYDVGGTGTTTASMNVTTSGTGTFTISGLSAGSNTIHIHNIIFGTCTSTVTGSTSSVVTVSINSCETFTSSGTFTVPSNVAQVSISLWGGGGGGGGGTSNYASAGGGAGGSFTYNGTVFVIPTTIIAVTVGTGGAGGASAVNGTAGGTSTFNSITPVSAIGGAGGSWDGAPGNGAGGGVTTGITWNGGAGGSYNLNYGGGGGGGAGSSGSGSNGATPAAGTGGTGGGGAGGAGGNLGFNGVNGTVPSGGGGGGGGNHTSPGNTGGSGANGQVTISWLPCSTNPNTYSLSPSGVYCTAQDIVLSGSQTGVDYQLLLNSIPTGTPMAGTGNAIDFGTQNATGTYIIVGYSTSTNCGAVMTGYVTVITPFTWVGTTNTDWNTASNWCGGVIPISSSIVVIPSGGNQPIIGSAGGVCNNITINSGATLTISGAYSLTVSGNWTNNGTFTTNTGTVIFNGTTNQTISGGATSFSGLTISNTGISGNNAVTDLDSAIISGALAVNNGIYVVDSGLRITSTGTGTIANGATLESSKLATTAAITATGTLTIQNGGTYKHNQNSGGIPTATWNTGSTCLVTGSTTTLPTNATFLQSFSNLTFNSPNQTVAANLGQDLDAMRVNGTLDIISTGTGSINFETGSATAINIPGNVQMDGGTLYFTSTQSPVVTISGNVTLNGGTLQTANGAGHPTLFIGGNWTLNTGGTFVGNTSGTSNITFNGTSAKTIGGTASTTFDSLRINNSAGVTLSHTETVTGRLAFANGTIATGSNTLALGNSVVDSGGSTASHVYGNLQIGIPAGTNQTYTFPIGDATNYTPVSLTFAGTTNGTGSITASTTTGQHPQIATSGINSTQDLARYCTINNNGVTGFTSYSPTFTFVSGDVIGGANTSNFIVCEYNSPNWTLPNVGTKTSTSTQITGVTTFSDFAIGDAGCAPPTTNITNNTGSTILTCNTTAISITATGGTTYSWSGGNTTNTAANSLTAAGTYTVTVTNSGGCSATSTITIIANNTSPTPSITPSGATTFCNGGSVTLDAGIYVSYLWSDNSTNEFLTEAATDNYLVTVTDGNGCTGMASQSVTVNTNPTPSITTNSATTFCNGGSVTLDAGSYSGYLWSDNTTNETTTETTTGNYSVTVTDGNGCTGIASQSVTVNSNPTPSITPSGATTFCNGGSVTLDAGNYSSYLWSDNSINEFLTETTTGNYSITITDGNGCTGVASQSVTVNLNPTPSITPNGATTFCNGGSVTLDAGSYNSYLWSDNSTNEFLSETATGNYSITVTDGNGCTGIASQSVTVNSNPTPSITPSGATTFCNGGSVELDAGTYSSYSWNTGDNTETITVYGSQPYCVTVTDGNGCTGTNCIFITVNANPTPSITPSGATTFCNGGSVTFDAGIYSGYLWSDNSTNGFLTETITGNYSVTVTDGNGCMGFASQSVTVNSNPTPSIIPSGATTFCNGGSVTLDAGIYNSYLYSDNSTIEFLTETTTGNYSVTVTDGNGCTGVASQSVTINTNPTPSITTNSATTFCNGGSVTLDAGSYSGYLWSDNTTNETTTETTTGNYSVTVTDGNGCTGIASQSVTANSNPTPSITPSGATTFCNGGSVTLDAGGYSGYLWSDNTTNETITITTTGNYSVTVTDGNGCTGIALQSVIVNSNPSPSITPSGATTFCNGGSVTLDAGNYSGYLWSDNSNNETLAVSTTGNYSVIVTDGNGCSGIASRPISVNSNPTPSITPSGATTFCNGGSVTLDAGSYSGYLWSDNTVNETTTETTTGNYSVTVTDGNGCTGVASQSITVNSNPTPSITPSGATTFCNGGSVTLDAGSYSGYLWSDNTMNETTTETTTGNYSVTVTDGNGCTGVASQSITVNSNPTPSITPNGATTFCNGGSVTLDAGSYSGYLWSDNTVNETTTETTAGNYTVIVTDGNGCTGVASQSITVNSNPTPSITPSGATTFCNGGSVTLDAGSYSGYLWSDNTVNETTTETTTGNYSVTVTDGNGCVGTTSQAVTVYSLPTVSINSVSGSCLNDAPVSLTASPSGGTFSGNGVTSSSFNPASAGVGTYTITYSYTDGNGCSSSASTNATVNANPMPQITSGASSICSGSNAILQVAGSYSSFLWNNGDSSNSITVSDSGNFTVTVTNAAGCAGTATQHIAIIPSPTAFISTSNGNAICSGMTDELDAGHYDSYEWNNGSTNEFVAVTSSGSFTVTITDIDGCTGVATVSITVNANPTPIITAGSSTTFCQGGSVSLCSGSSYSNYNWGAYGATSCISATTSGTYSMTVTNSNGCTGTASQNVTVNSLPTVGITGTSTACTSVSLTATGGSSYLWSGGTSTNTASNTIASSGTYYVTVTNINNCSATSSKVVTVNSLPTSGITGTSTGCSSVSLTATGGTSYLWSGGNATTSAANTFNTSGTYSVTVTNSNSCSATTSKSVTINSLPTAGITGTSTGCASVSLTATGGTSYLWSGGNATTSAANTFNTSGTYTVTVTNANSCTATTSISVTAYSLPTAGITGTGSGCTSVSLTATGGTSYHWSGGTSTNTAANTFASSGTYTVTVTNSNACTGIASKAVTVNSLPTVNAGSTKTVYFNSGSGNPTTADLPSCSTIAATLGNISGTPTYSWFPTTRITSGMGTSTITACPTVTTTYTLTVTSGSGCTASSSVVVNAIDIGGDLSAYQVGNNKNKIYVCYDGTTYESNANASCNSSQSLCYYLQEGAKLGQCSARLYDVAENNSSTSFNVYPNPATDNITIVFTSDKEETATIRLVDMLGRVVKSQASTSVIGENYYQMNLSELSKGIYMILLQNGDAFMQTKIVVQ